MENKETEKSLSSKKTGKQEFQKESYKKEIENYKIHETKSDLAVMKEYYALLFGLIAQRVIDSFGKEGNQVVRRAIRDFGEIRGKKLRDRHLQYGLELNLVNLNAFCDFPGDDDQESDRQDFEKDKFLSYIDECELFDVWKEYGLMDAGIAYCEEIHHAMWAAYHEDMVLVMEDIMTRGACRCSFQESLPNFQARQNDPDYKQGKLGRKK